jgi:hypothetical protein
MGKFGEEKGPKFVCLKNSLFVSEYEINFFHEKEFLNIFTHALLFTREINSIFINKALNILYTYN